MHYAEAVARALHTRINAARESQQHPPLSPEQPLIDTARSYARSLAHLGRVTHTHETTPAARVAPYGGPAENLARVERRGSPGDVARYVTRKWRRSKLHRKNLMNDAASYHGLGVWQSHGELFVVELLAERKPLRRHVADAVGLSG